jgi:hypothetical protein
VAGKRPCRCFACLLESGTLAEIAPQIARARDAEVLRRRQAGRRRLAARREQLKYERLVAHRELQLIRAGRGSSPGYIAQRQRKVEHARKLLARATEVVNEAVEASAQGQPRARRAAPRAAR